MYTVGEYVVKSGDGLCRVDGVVELDLFRNNDKKPYYVLIPVAQPKSKIYASVEKAPQQVRKTISKADAIQLIEKIPQLEEVRIINDREREQEYRKAIQSSDLEVLIVMVKNMYHRRKMRIARGKKNTMMDERYFQLAEDRLYEELAFALNRDKEEMKQFIEMRMEQ